MLSERDQGMDIPLTGTEVSAGETMLAGMDVPFAGETTTEETTTGETTAGESTAGDFMVCDEVTKQAIQVLLPVDIVWVIDSSPNVGEKIAQVQSNLNALTQRISTAGLDLRIDLVGAEADMVTPDRDYLGICIPPPLSATDICPDVDSARYKHIRLNVHSSDPLNKMLEAAPQFSGFFRTTAFKHIIFVSDDDAGWGNDADSFQLTMNADPLLQGAMIHSVVDLVGYQSSYIFDDNCSCGDERG